MRNINWSEVEETNNAYPVAGGYAARITRVEDREEKEYLQIEWDFAEGQYKNSNHDCETSKGFLPHCATFYRSYKEKALPFFKGFKTSVEDSNSGYTFRNDPQSLVGKYVGVILGEEEYEGSDGSIKTRLYVHSTCAGSKIRSGEFKVPELKKLKADNHTVPAKSNPFTEIVDDGDLPF